MNCEIMKSCFVIDWAWSLFKWYVSLLSKCLKALFSFSRLPKNYTTCRWKDREETLWKVDHMMKIKGEEKSRIQDIEEGRGGGKRSIAALGETDWSPHSPRGEKGKMITVRRPVFSWKGRCKSRKQREVYPSVQVCSIINFCLYYFKTTLHAKSVIA